MDTEKLIRDVVQNVIKRLKSELPQGREVPGSGQRLDVKAEEKEGPAAVGVETIRASRREVPQRKIVCGVSVRHVHLSREHVDVLYGKDYKLQILRELYQPGTYAYKETVTIVGPKLNAIQNVRILGPLRDRTQVELAKTDCIILGIDAPVRASGDLEGSASAVLIGPKGAVYLSEGVIRANRHIHLSQEDADYFGIKDNQLVDVRVGGPKGLTFNNVQVRVSPEFKSEMHVDTDDANAADLVNGSLVEIVDASCISPIVPAMADANHTPPPIPDSSFAGEITDTNILKSMSVFTPVKGSSVFKFFAGSQPETVEGKSSPEGSGSGSSPGSRPGKILITVNDLDNYKDTGIKLGPNVILTPLARDEALARGIKIFQ
ncbi:MAG: phosphate propanoyltransferase [Actinobacteria bacterium]|nr:phosphate propanoyltransferase [Actinomycetota bacterium]